MRRDQPRPRPAARRPRTRVPDPPQCRHFGTCGACDRLDQPIEQQLADKVAALEHLLHPWLAGQRVRFALPPRTPLHYRTRLLYPARPGPDGRPVLGHFAFRSHDVVRITECRTQDRGLTELGRRAEGILRELGIPAWDPATRAGDVRALHARLAAGTGELLIGVVTGPGVFARGPELAHRLMAAARDLPDEGRQRTVPVGVVRSISERDDEFLLGDRTVPLLGRDHQIDRSDGLTFRVTFGSFQQIHRGAADLLYRPALALVGDVAGQRVVDGFGGIGAFGLRLGRAGAATVTVVEDNPVAARDAEHNATTNAIAGVQVVTAPFAEADFPPGADLLVVDPPRSGLGPAGVRRCLDAQPRRLLHVACSAEALARDLAGLTAGGCRVVAMQLCDLFPHTGHAEVLTLLAGSSEDSPDRPAATAASRGARVGTADGLP